MTNPPDQRADSLTMTPGEGRAYPALAIEGAISGLLMGLANLVPGVSAGAVLLATGVFQRFINGVAEVSTFRFRAPTLVLLGAIGCGWVLAVLLGAGVVKSAVIEHRWIAYSVFVGLTLGGVPLVWRGRDERTSSLWTGAVIGFLVMASLAVVQMSGVIPTSREKTSMGLLFIGGVLGAGATVLPGGSGTFVLLLVGLYVPVLAAVDRVRAGLSAGDVSAVLDQAWTLGPLAVGLGIGLATVSLILKWTLVRFPRATYGVLLGLLLGSVVGLFPFQRSVAPRVGDMIKGRAVTSESLPTIEADDWPVAFFTPTIGQVALSLIIIAVACALTIALTRFEQRHGPPHANAE